MARDSERLASTRRVLVTAVVVSNRVSCGRSVHAAAPPAMSVATMVTPVSLHSLVRTASVRLCLGNRHASLVSVLPYGIGYASRADAYVAAYRPTPRKGEREWT